jgi:hypothetical protein
MAEHEVIVACEGRAARVLLVRRRSEGDARCRCRFAGGRTGGALVMSVPESEQIDPSISTE